MKTTFIILEMYSYEDNFFYLRDSYEDDLYYLRDSYEDNHYYLRDSYEGNLHYLRGSYEDDLIIIIMMDVVAEWIRHLTHMHKVVDSNSSHLMEELGRSSCTSLPDPTKVQWILGQ